MATSLFHFHELEKVHPLLFFFQLSFFVSKTNQCKKWCSFKKYFLMCKETKEWKKKTSVSFHFPFFWRCSVALEMEVQCSAFFLKVQCFLENFEGALYNIISKLMFIRAANFDEFIRERSKLFIYYKFSI